MTIDDLMEELNVKDWFEEVSHLMENSINKDEEYLKNLKDIFSRYVDYLYELIINAPFEKVVMILDYFNDTMPGILAFLLEKKDERIYRATLLLEKINNIEMLDIKYNLDSLMGLVNVRTILTSNDKAYGSIKDLQNVCETKYTLLHEYLKDKEDSLLESNLLDDFRNFGNGLCNIDAILFSSSLNNNVLNRSNIINKLFLEASLDIDTLNKIYKEVLLKNKYLKSFDYDEIIFEKEDYLETVKGLFRKCSDEYFSCANNLEFNEEEFKAFDNSIRKIIEINKDDTNGIYWFISKLYENSSKQIKEFLEQQDYYHYYMKYNMEDIYEEMINKLLNNEKDIDMFFLESLGSYKGFRLKYDVFLNKFYESNDIEYQKKLLIPLTLGLIEQQKEKYGLDFKIVRTTKNINNNTLGSYSRKENEMYVNYFVLDYFDDAKHAFVSVVNTIFHEVRHVLQMNTVETSNEFSYDNLLMAMDLVLKDKTLVGGYYDKNYDTISFEQDARDIAYVDTMRFFDGREDMLELVSEENRNTIMTNFVRKDFIGVSTGILNYFMSKYDLSYETEEDKKENIDELLLLMNKYPVFEEFFEIDYERVKIVLKSKDYFLNKRKELESMPDCISKLEGLYSIKMLSYALKVGKYLKDIEYKRFLNNVDNELLGEDIINNIGEIPKRR